MDIDQWFEGYQDVITDRIKNSVSLARQEASRRGRLGRNPFTTTLCLEATFKVLEEEIFSLLEELIKSQPSYDDLTKFQNRCINYIKRIKETFYEGVISSVDFHLGNGVIDKKERLLISKLNNKIEVQKKLSKDRKLKFIFDIIKTFKPGSWFS